MSSDGAGPNPFDGAFPQQKINALNIETNVYEAGRRNGHPIVMLHGMSASGDSFRELMEGLADDQWLIAPDLPGFGFTETTEPYNLAHLNEWLAALFDALELPPALVMGHSFGGLVAGAFALAYPEDVTGLVLFAPALATAKDFPEWAREAAASVDFLGVINLGAALSQAPVMLERRIRTAFFDPDILPDTLWARRLVEYEHSRATADVLKLAATAAWGEELAEMEKPLWLIWGKQDLVLPPAQGDHLAELIPRAQLFLLDNCGHIPMQEKPGEVLEIIRAYLNEHDGRNGRSGAAA